LRNLSVKFPGKSEWKDGFQTNRKGGLTWYTDGSKTNNGTGAEVYGYGIRWKLSFSLGQYTTVFQVEVYAIKACTGEDLKRNYTNRNIYILSESHTAIIVLDNYKINPQMV
jgi:hypothetical protein